MTTSTVQSVSLLPIYFQTNKNSKFLSSTIDQLIQPAQLERLNSYIGSTSTPTYQSGDVYLTESSTLRQTYQLDPALVTYDQNSNIQSVVSIDDLVNEISIDGGITDNFDRLFRDQIHSYYPQINWDKLINYQNYYWLAVSPMLVEIDQNHLDVANTIVGQTSAQVTVNGTALTLLNGMLVTFIGNGVESQYKHKEFFVEGTGTSITLVPYNDLITPELIASNNNPDLFDSQNFDNYVFDNNQRLPITPEYVTINRASIDKNPWSRYNRWFSKDVITASNLINNQPLSFNPSLQGKRPIIEFNADIQLYNFGSVGVAPVDLIETKSTDALNTIEGYTFPGTTSISSLTIDGVNLEYGQRVIFSADINPLVKNNIYKIDIIQINNSYKLVLIPDTAPIIGNSVTITKGNVYSGTSWHFNGSTWVYSQQHTKINEGPLFELYDNNGISYSDTRYYLSNFNGNKIFGYSINSNNPVDPVLGISLDYRNVNAIGSFLFKNYFTDNAIALSVNNINSVIVPDSLTNIKVGSTLINIWSPTTSNTIGINGSTGYYNVPLGLTNNPLNGPISSFTLSDLAKHVQTNTRLITNATPLSFAMMFLGKKEHNVVDAINKSSALYNYFKLSLINQASLISNVIDPASALDEILITINSSKTNQSPYYLSDMVPYGVDKKVLTYTVSNTTTNYYSLSNEFSLNTATFRSIIIYLNNNQLTYGVDYTFDPVDAYVIISASLAIGDIIVINDYNNTRGSFVPPTPTKLGLYPAYVPKIYLDNTYANASINVIQGHDGSIMVAFNDYRDAIILEYELRVYNNIKAQYQPKLFDINISNPGAFRDFAKLSDYSYQEITDILEQDFIKWAGSYGVDYTTNNTYDSTNPFTWNYKNSFNPELGLPISGNWRSIFKYFYDTDRPHTHPWEMLGLTTQPDWWETLYGVTPYTAGNYIMWDDIEAGNIAQGDRAGINIRYARPGLKNFLPVDYTGILLDPVKIGLVSEPNIADQKNNWVVGDQGPTETAWRRSSFWPFTVQRLLALTNPSSYASLMYDPINMSVDIAGQWTYGSSKKFLQLPNMPIHGEDGVPTSGYSVFVSEVGQQRTQNYITQLRQDLQYVNFNLFYKVGGFVNKNTLQIIIDAYSPTTNDPGALLPNESYSLILKTSNPIRSIGISGIIVQRSDSGFIVKGYDQENPYFNCYPAVRNSASPKITIGGVSSSYVTWTPLGTTGATGLSALDTISAKSSPSTAFYQVGQIVQYGSNFYRVTVSHQAEATFNSNLYQILSDLPTVGGATVQIATKFNKTAIQVPYGTAFTSIQQVYDLIVGYGQWLVDQGFSFNQFNQDLGTTIDWNLSAREFLYWSTQNWNSNSVITLSPFADQLTYQYKDSVVDNIFNSFYNYSITKADGTPFDQKSLFVTRQNGIFNLNVINTDEGIYFARLNSIQKEHGIVFDNTSIFGDVIYDIETGERQERMKLVGFRTANWNGDFFSPGFVYDEATITIWTPYTNYLASSIVKYNGVYYSAIKNITGGEFFVFTQWRQLGKKPVAGLLPNFDYKISQFNDFYSLDIDNFDAGQQQAAQNLTGYVPRPYLNNIFTDPVSQYKFYQGYIREKGTLNSITKLAKASLHTLNSEIEFNEEWAVRVGQYGSFTTYKEFEVPLIEGTFLENPQIISFTESIPENSDNLIYYATPDKLTISPFPGTIPAIATTSSSSSAFKLNHSGYAQLNDVNATAYNLNSILDIANNDKIIDNTTIWLGYTPNGDWDIYRYERIPVEIISASSDTVLNQITLNTDYAHSLTATQLISIVNFNSDIDGIYFVQSTPTLTSFVISNTTGILNTTPTNNNGLLFVFNSTRFLTFDNIPSDRKLFKYPLGTNLWVDSGNGTDNNGWAVYKKIINHNHHLFASYDSVPKFEGLGYSISRPKGSSIMVLGAPTYANTINSSPISGNVIVYETPYGTLSPFLHYQMSGASTEFGHTVVYDDIPFSTSTYGLIFVGAPGSYANSGSVRISSINQIYEEQTQLNLYNPQIVSSHRFGSSIYVQRNASTKKVLVGAPGTTGDSSTPGAVYSYIISSTATVKVNSVSELSLSYSLTNGSEWGHTIVGSENAKYIAISAPGTSTGIVAIFVNGVQTQILSTSTSERFGDSMAMSPDGSYLAIGAPQTNNQNNSLGEVRVYTLTNGTYILDQILTNPVDRLALAFGSALDFNESATKLAISAIGTDTSIYTTFDNNATTFDVATTVYYEAIENSGSAYLYSRRDKRFVYSEELTTSTIYDTINSTVNITGTNYGTSISVDDDFILIGAPSISASSSSAVHQFLTVDPTILGWQQLRVQDDLVLTDSVQKISLVDTINEDILNYYDFVDPIKGKILGIAEQELTYKSSNDPAVYSIGTDTVSVDANVNWLENHTGNLWWDISTARFIWYEQGNLEYRRNNWGKLFPGATIDVYEWVESSLLPSDWAIKADTSVGLAQGISGQPKYPDNSVLSVKQVYDPVSGGFSNLYYYWVKNKTTVPSVKNRRISAYSVANYISNPTTSGIQYSALLSSSSIMLANLGSELVSNQISLNLAIDNTNNTVPKHTEWALMQEGVETSYVPKLLEKKLIDSLVGRDVLGTPVPDPRLSSRSKFGVSIRPQQTLFSNRYEALRNIVEFANSVLIGVQITGNYNFANLTAKEPAPTQYLTVEDPSELTYSFIQNATTATVLSDSLGNGNWAVYSYQNNEWVRVRTPSYDVSQYWSYIDWSSSSYNKNIALTAIVDSTYELNQLNLSVGQYVKVKNRGDGNFVILEKNASNNQGTYGNNFNLVYVQNGTIQFLDTVWDRAYGWDEYYSYNQTLFDQAPDLELNYILSALKDDLFINDLRVNWNLLFFKAIKYAFTEQKSIDWAFKTSFINVTNFAGTLTQPPVYKLQDSSYYESYISEVKPYHTQIRKFTTKFENTETTDILISDFDFPAYYDFNKNSFVPALVSATEVTSNPVRTVSGAILFDRVGINNQIGGLIVSDNFITNDVTIRYQLSWLAQADRSTISVYFNNSLVLPTDYTLEYYTREYNGYHKKYNDLVFVNAPNTGTITINYHKSVDLMTASERIHNFYEPDVGMPGKQLEQLMVGAVDPRTQFGGQYEGKGFTNIYGGFTPDTQVSSGGLLNVDGINPAERIIDGGYNFISTHSGVAPEELVPGVVADTIGIQVYTKPMDQTPTMITGTIPINIADYNPYDNYYYNLSILPPTIDSILVSYNGNNLEYVPEEFVGGNIYWSFASKHQFGIDWGNSKLVIPAQLESGVLGYSIINVGDSNTNGVGVIESRSRSVYNATSTEIICTVDYSEVSSAYVTVNGVPITNNPTDYNTLYTLGYYTFYSVAISSSNGHAASVYVYNIPPGSNAIEVWLFNSNQSNFNKLTEEHFIIGDIPTFAPGGNAFNQSVALLYPPENIGPPSSQAIVEYTPVGGTTIRLLPPSVVYYPITTTATTTYPAIDINGPFVAFTATQSLIDIDNVNVYHNGMQLTLGQDFIVNTTDTTVTVLNTSSISVGDTIAVESFVNNDVSKSFPNNNPYSYDYMITNQGNLLLSPNYSNSTNFSLKVITFSNQDRLNIETKTFIGNPNRIFTLDRPVLNENYIWVMYNDPNVGMRSLINGVDFQILSDYITVLISDTYAITPSDTIFIMSFANPTIPDNILGYRISNDFLGNTTFTRIANQNSTYLTKPLSFTDTEIHVADSTILSPADPLTNSPGVILINGERIEFFVNEDNVLGQLRRATRGTGPAYYSEEGTVVIDQGIDQIINISPGNAYSEHILVQNTYTSASLSNTYVISTSTMHYINTITSSTIRCDGIVLNTVPAALPVDPYTGYYGPNNVRLYTINTASFRAVDQLLVKYGGRYLAKDVYYSQDTTVSYDGISVSQIVGSVATAADLVNVPVYLGDAYVCEDTNYVWVCIPTHFNESSIPNFVDSGLRRRMPDFTIDTSTQLLTLNISNITLHVGALLTVIKQQAGPSWNDLDPANTITNTLSLLNSTGTIATFLKEGPAVLPTDYFYGGNLDLLDNSGSVLLDQNGAPLRGF